MAGAITVSSVSKSFGSQRVLGDVSFEIPPGSKTGLVGQNGSGKTTLLNIIYGLERADTGEVMVPGDLRLGYMSQESDLDPDMTLLAAVSAPTGLAGSIARRVKYLEAKLEGGLPPDEMEAVSREYARALEDFGACGGFGHPSRAEGVLERLGMEKRAFGTRVGDLSGGERTKARLARIVMEAEDADLLLLDEPTNHLDIETTEWLEDYLAGYRGAVLMVSHDRYLLDKLVDRIVALENGTARVYEGNHSAYMEKRALELENAEKRYRKQQKEIQRQREMIAFMYSRYTYKSIHKTRQRMLDRMDKVDRPVDTARRLSISFAGGDKSGKDVADALGISKDYGQGPVIGKSSFRIEKGQKVGLIGANGSGKTTLVRMLMGLEEPTTGTVKLSRGVSIGYYDQEQDGLVRGSTVIQEIRKHRKDASEEWVRNFLARFFFRGGAVFKRVFQLSGGERARLAIAKLLLSPHNFLILDEPTNYLDIYSKAAVAQALVEYQGTVLLISHDRALLDSVATDIFELRDGVLRTYPGNYSDYLAARNSTGLSTGGDTYVVTRKYTDWSTGTRYTRGQTLKLTDAELEGHRWALDNGFLVRKKTGGNKRKK